MDTLKLQIKRTNLFSPQEKIDLIIGIDTFTDEQRIHLASVINEFDTKQNQLTSSFKKDTLLDLDRLEIGLKGHEADDIQKTIHNMRSGLTTAFPDV